MKYYAVKGVDFENIYNSWDEAKKVISEISGPKYKAFSTLEEAEAFLRGEELFDSITEPKCYIDGSFDQNTDKYSFGGVLIINNEPIEFKRSFGPDEYSQYRNVSGEIRGTAYIVNYCQKRGITRLHIFYDYIGIEKWYKMEWKANTNIAIRYVEFAKSMDGKIEVIFHKVKSHTNNKYNERADKLAKEALGIL